MLHSAYLDWSLMHTSKAVHVRTLNRFSWGVTSISGSILRASFCLIIYFLKQTEGDALSAKTRPISSTFPAQVWIAGTMLLSNADTFNKIWSSGLFFMVVCVSRADIKKHCSAVLFLLQAVHFFFEPSIYSIFAVMFNTQIFRVDPWLWTQRNSSLCLGKAFVAFFSSFFFFLLHLYGERRRISSCTHLCIFCLARYVLVHLKVIVQRMDDM